MLMALRIERGCLSESIRSERDWLEALPRLSEDTLHERRWWSCVTVRMRASIEARPARLTFESILSVGGEVPYLLPRMCLLYVYLDSRTATRDRA